MPATPMTIEVIKDRNIQPVVPGLSQGELAERLKDVFWGDEIFDIPQPRYLMDTWLPAHSLVFLTGHGQAGKSLLAIAWGQCIARGVQWSGNDVLDPGKVLYLTQEGLSSIPYRVKAFMQERGFEKAHPHFGVLGDSLSIGAVAGDNGLGDYGPDWERVEELVAEHKPKAVIIDPWVDFFTPGRENSNDDVSLWVKRLRQLLNSLGENAPTIIVVAHTSDANKTGGSPRGATASYDGADRVYTVSPLFPVTDRQGKFVTHGDLLGMKVSTLKSKDGGRPEPWYGEIKEHTVEGALKDRSVTVDGISRDRFRELETLATQYNRDIGKADTAAAPADHRDRQADAWCRTQQDHRLFGAGGRQGCGQGGAGRDADRDGNTHR